MLTFLRKIRKSLSETGNTRKYFLYAIGEILLVVIGILIALQINNWNEASKLLNKEKQVYSEIHSELAETLDDVLDDQGDLERNFNATLDVRDMIIRNQIQKDTLLYLLRGVFDLEHSTPKSSAFESLTSLGLDILSNDSLRQEITTLYQITVPSLTTSEVAVRYARSLEKTYPLFEPYLIVERGKILAALDDDERAIRGGRFLEIQNIDAMVQDEHLLLTIQESLGPRFRIQNIHLNVAKEIRRVMLNIETELNRLS